MVPLERVGGEELIGVGLSGRAPSRTRRSHEARWRRDFGSNFRPYHRTFTEIDGSKVFVRMISRYLHVLVSIGAREKIPGRFPAGMGTGGGKVPFGPQSIEGDEVIVPRF